MSTDSVSPALSSSTTPERRRRTDAEPGAQALGVVVESLPVGILMVDQAGHITLVNAMGEKILGYARHELIGRPVEMLLPERLRGTHANDRQGFLDQPVQRKMGAGRDLFALHKDGHEVPVEIGLSPATTADGTFVLASIIDISERKAREALAAKHEELLRIERQKEELAALLVHDLKSPAAGIMMAAQSQLRRASATEAERKLWGLVFTSAEVINRMVLNLLDIASSADGVFAPRRALVDVPALIAAVHQLMTPVADSLGQQITISVAPSIPQFYADPELLRRVLQNLVDNALRHNPAGVPVRMEADGSPERVTFRVCDSGPGIPPALKERIFDKYVRLSRAQADRVGFGKGLGLAFSRIAVEAHGGRIWVSDNTPTGSVFSFEIPTQTPQSS